MKKPTAPRWWRGGLSVVSKSRTQREHTPLADSCSVGTQPGLGQEEKRPGTISIAARFSAM
jgi:hypothetical protein